MDGRDPLLSNQLESELNRQLFHLKTLYGVSRKLLGLVEIDAILRNFLLMTLGNFLGPMLWCGNTYSGRMVDT